MRLKGLIKSAGLVLALPLLAIIAGLVWVAWQVMVNKTGDDDVHMRSKAAYLEHLAGLAEARDGPKLPNVLIVYYDDLGYGDLGFTGSKAIRTPNIDALAVEGVVLSNYHSPSPVCSPSRAGLLTGRLPPRAGVPSVEFQSDSPLRIANYSLRSSNRFPAEEITIADAFKANGYRTGMIGKWHLGDVAPSLPNRFGFDSFLGSLYSNDMQPFAIYQNEKQVIPAPADQTKIDKLYTDAAVHFINENAASQKPFLLYLAHNFPHQPLHVAPERRGRSAAGLYGDVVEALDAGIGRIVKELKRTGQFDDTIIIVTSDNGPWYQGSPGAFRGRKGQVFEGGTHVPFVIHWPAGIPGRRVLSDRVMGIDILPTLFDWTGLPLPSDRRIDGISLRALLEGKGPAPQRFIYFYAGNSLSAVSDGRFKYFPRQPIAYVVSGSRFVVSEVSGPWLFDMMTDPDESYDVSMRYPNEARRLKAVLDTRNADMEANPRGWN